ncbi:MAG: hypothetical protein PWQ82_361 [Thermosediminibacterales bacterium]|nr:hypothetical protein [Thermosediminibacterales bacterium]
MKPGNQLLERINICSKSTVLTPAKPSGFER